MMIVVMLVHGVGQAVKGQGHCPRFGHFGMKKREKGYEGMNFSMSYACCYSIFWLLSKKRDLNYKAPERCMKFAKGPLNIVGEVNNEVQQLSFNVFKPNNTKSVLFNELSSGTVSGVGL